MSSLRKLKINLTFLTILLSLNLMSQEGSPIENTSKLEELKKILIQDYPNQFREAKILNVKKINSKHSKVNYIKEGIYFETVVNSNREDLLIISKAKEIPTSELPSIVKDAFKNELNQDTQIEKAFIVSNPYSSDFFRIDIELDNNKNKSFYYDKLGKYKEPPY